jgi:hypothetical protein
MNKFGIYLQYLILDVGFGVMSNFFILENVYNLVTKKKKKSLTMNTKVNFSRKNGLLLPHNEKMFFDIIIFRQ